MQGLTIAKFAEKHLRPCLDDAHRRGIEAEVEKFRP